MNVDLECRREKSVSSHLSIDILRVDVASAGASPADILDRSSINDDQIAIIQRSKLSVYKFDHMICWYIRP